MIEQYSARQVTATRIASLRSRAIREVRCITAECGLCYVQRADDLRWDDASQTAQVRIGGVWLSITPLGLQDWAAAENLQLVYSVDVIDLQNSLDSAALACESFSETLYDLQKGLQVIPMGQLVDYVTQKARQGEAEILFNMSENLSNITAQMRTLQRMVERYSKEHVLDSNDFVGLS